ncbi:MAG: phosphatase [Clostridia bacterium]|nr:phosphatase [Clostridia bacterium]
MQTIKTLASFFIRSFAVEDIYAHCGLTQTNAINIFIQQSINMEGMPLLVTKNSKDAIREQAIGILMAELRKGELSASNSEDWIPEKEILAKFGVDA